MSKKTGYTLLIIGLSAQAVDVLTYKADKGGGALFGSGGLLAKVDEKVPKVTLFGVATNIAFWFIVAGVLILIIRR
jgi:hypothetical protein